MNSKWGNVILLSLSCLLSLSLWFSATAVAPIITAEWGLSDNETAWLTMAVQMGFALGAFLIAFFNIADLFQPRIVFAAGCLIGAAANLAVTGVGNQIGWIILLRGLTGAAIAAVYPVGMKMLTTWMKEDRGLGLGLLVGCITIGSAGPHLLRVVYQINQWQPVLWFSSMLALIGGLIVFVLYRPGPFVQPAPKFRFQYVLEVFRNRPLMQANIGYFGHMWELYAMWTWMALFLLESFRQSNLPGPLAQLGPERVAALSTFFIIALGGLGSFYAGYLADRWGRTRTTMASMIISGVCAAVIGFFFGGSPVVLLVIAAVWGTAIVADSAQFSSAASELCDKKFIGTVLTLQTSIGFMLTLVSIRLIPVLVKAVGWRWAFASLTIGPVLGTLAMRQLKNSPAARSLAGGRG